MIHPTPTELERNKRRDDINLSNKFNEYESTFVILSPFLKLKKGAPYINLSDFENYPKKSEILESTEKYSWANLTKDFSLNGLKDVANLIYNHWDPSSSEKTKLDLLTKGKNLFPPNEGFISELNENAILKSILDLGYDKVLYETETGEKSKVDIEKFIKENKAFDAAPLIKTFDEKICIYQAFDLVSTFLSSSKENLDFIVKNTSLEGFYVDEKSTLLWWQLK